MRPLNDLEMEMVMGGNGGATAPVCTSGGNAGAQTSTCVIGDLMITNACTLTQVDLGFGAGVDKAGAKADASGKVIFNTCTTTVVNTKTGAVSTTNNTPSRSMAPGSSSRPRTPGVMLMWEMTENQLSSW